MSVNITMYDSTDANNLPPNVEAFAGYVNGKWPSYFAMVRRFPHIVANHRDISIAVTLGPIAKFLDIENGDATPDQAPKFVLEAEHAGIWRPGLYANRSTMPFVTDALRKAGIAREKVRLWVGTPRTSLAPPMSVYDAEQQLFDFHGCDVSTCLDPFFPAIQPLHQPVTFI